jgi:hypothetical protein
MQDIERLDEGQFLNDSLINFYLRYLEHGLLEEGPDLVKRVYFHNTFFYKTLTTITRGHRGINYEAVERWTAKVDLLSYDYIIVPVNESTHWYLAIICNAPKLLPSESEISCDSQTVEKGNGPKQETTPDNKADSSPPPSSSPQPAQGGGPDQEIRIEGLTIHQNEEGSWPASYPKPVQEAPTTPPTKVISITDSFDGPAEGDVDKPDSPPLVVSDLIQADTKISTPPKKGKRKSIPGPRKYNPKEPRIVTLDSLGVKHSPTCTNLRDYIVAEIKSKRGIEISPPGPLGTTATDIPEQNNFCDCGLYVLSYVEKFLKQPDEFIHNICQRTTDLTDWTTAPEMRVKIRDLLFDLQTEQSLEAEKLQLLQGKGKKKSSSDKKSKNTVPTNPQETSTSARKSSTPNDRENAQPPSRSHRSSPEPTANLGRKRSASRDPNPPESKKSRYWTTEEPKPQRMLAKYATSSTRVVHELDVDDQDVQERSSRSQKTDRNAPQLDSAPTDVEDDPSNAHESCGDNSAVHSSTHGKFSGLISNGFQALSGLFSSSDSPRVASDTSRPGGSSRDALKIQDSPQKASAKHSRSPVRRPSRQEEDFVSPSPEQDAPPRSSVRRRQVATSPQPEAPTHTIQDDHVIPSSSQSSTLDDLGLPDPVPYGEAQRIDDAEMLLSNGPGPLSTPNFLSPAPKNSPSPATHERYEPPPATSKTQRRGNHEEFAQRKAWDPGHRSLAGRDSSDRLIAGKKWKGVGTTFSP